MSSEAPATVKRQLEEVSGESETSPNIRRRTEDDTNDKQEVSEPGPSQLSTTQAEPGPSTNAKSSRGKNKRVPLSRKEAREARKNNNTRRGTRPERAGGEDGGEGRERSEPRLPKRQCALLLGFCGSGCSGMQLCVSFLVPTPGVLSLLSMCVYVSVPTNDNFIFLEFARALLLPFE